MKPYFNGSVPGKWARVVIPLKRGGGYVLEANIIGNNRSGFEARFTYPEMRLTGRDVFTYAAGSKMLSHFAGKDPVGKNFGNGGGGFPSPEYNDGQWRFWDSKYLEFYVAREGSDVLIEAFVNAGPARFVRTKRLAEIAILFPLWAYSHFIRKH